MEVIRKIIREELSSIMGDEVKSTEEKQRIRVSCAGLASVKIGEKYLLVQNNSSRKQGKIVYGPLGGALEYLPGAESFFKELDAEKERSTPDLRLFINLEDLDKFADWFYSGKDRETSSKREVYEELVLEEKALPGLKESDISESYSNSVRDRKEKDGVESERFFEIFRVKFSPNIEKEIIRISKNPKSTIGLFTKEEILSEGIVSDHSKFILQ
jgi:hypothetical protein